MEKSVVTDHNSEILSVISLNQRYFATGSKDRTIKIYDMQNTYSPLFTLKGMINPATNMCKIPKSGNDWNQNPLAFYLLTSDDPTIKVWDLSSHPPKIIQTLSGHNDRITDISPITQHLAFSSALEGRVIIWDLRNLKNGKVLEFHKPIFCTTNFSNKKQIAIGTDDDIKIIDIVYDGFDPNSGYLESALVRQELKESSAVCNLKSFRTNNNLIVAGLRNGYVNVWNINERQMLNSIEGFNGAVEGMFLITSHSDNPDVYVMAYSANETTIKLGNIDGRALNIVSTSHPVMFTPCGTPCWQILDADSDKGFTFMTITNHNNRPPAITIWGLRDR